MPRRRTPRLVQILAAAAIFGVGVVIGVGCGGGSGPAPSEYDRFLDDTIIAEVGPYTITARDLSERLQNQYSQLVGDGSATAEQSIRELLGLDVRHLCLVAEAERIGFDDTSRVFVQKMEVARRKVLQEEYTEKIIYERARPTPDEIRAYYEENKNRYRIVPRVAARHILLGTEAEAVAAMARIEAGEPFADVATELTLDDTSRRSGGATGWLQTSRPIRGLGDVPELVETAFALEPDELGVVQSGLGWHVVSVIRKEEAGFRPFEDVRDSIEEQIFTTQSRAEYDEELRQLRERFGARINDEGLAAFLSYRRADDESALFEEAQQKSDPNEKIATYEEYLRKYPHSEHACEAQFMIAFVRAEELKEVQAARLELNEFIKACPESELVESAQFLLDELSHRKK